MTWVQEQLLRCVACQPAAVQLTVECIGRPLAVCTLCATFVKHPGTITLRCLRGHAHCAVSEHVFRSNCLVSVTAASTMLPWLPKGALLPCASNMPTMLACIGCKNMTIVSYLHQLPCQLLQLSFTQLLGVDSDAALGPAKWNVHHSCLPGHQTCKTVAQANLRHDVAHAGDNEIVIYA